MNLISTYDARRTLVETTWRFERRCILASFVARRLQYVRLLYVRLLAPSWLSASMLLGA